MLISDKTGYRALDRDWFQARMKAMGGTQAGLARKLGVHRSAITNLLKGTRALKLGEVETVAVYLGVPPEEVLNRAGLPVSLTSKEARMQATNVGFQEAPQSAFGEDGSAPASQPMPELVEPGQVDSKGRRLPPLFGCLKGTTIIMPGVDLTEPADPDWGRVYDADFDHGVVAPKTG